MGGDLVFYQSCLLHRERGGKVLKNLKKVLDKRDRVWYSIKAVCSAESAAEKKVEKK